MPAFWEMFAFMKICKPARFTCKTDMPLPTCRLTPADVHAERRGPWSRTRLPPALGDCHSDSVSLAPGLTLIATRYRPERDLVEESRRCLPRPLLSLTFGLQGHSSFEERRGQQLRFDCGSVTISSFIDAQGERRYSGSAEQHVEQLRLQLDEELLTAYLGEAAARQLLRHASGVRLLACRPASAAALAHARALAWQAIHPAPDRPGRLLALHAGALALLHEQLRLLPASGPTPLAAAAPQVQSPRLLRPQEAARMEQARRWLLAHAHESVSIRRLADELHMSESRLRRSFRQAWGGSPQDFHTRARMALALRHLQAGCRVTETAWRVGYGQPGNFSQAFTRHFGYPPSQALGTCSRSPPGNEKFKE